MMHKFFLLLFTPLLIFAKVHYAKVEPYDSVVLKSAVSAKVLEVSLEDEGQKVEAKRVIHLDDRLDKINLENSQKSIRFFEQMLTINQEIAKSLKGSMERQESYYKRISTLSTASKTQKDNAYSSYTSVKTQYLGTKEKIVSLEKQIMDMRYQVAQLEDIIEKKSIFLTRKYLYKLMVRSGDFVNPGTPLAEVQDIAKAKLVLFLDPEELDGIERKTVYLDNKRTEYKVNKVWRVADEKYISSYRAEIYIPAPETMFSKLMKVELK